MKNRSPKRLVRVLLFGAGALILGGGMIGLFAAFVFVQGLPPVEQLTNREVPESTKIFDRTGAVLLYEISAGQKRTLVPLENIPQTLRSATIAVEDEKFYTEPGFDWRAIIRAVIANLRNQGIVQGASTITQQLAKNAFLSPEQTITRKIKELFLAIQIARHYPKDKILELYLNEIPYGPTHYGVEAAANAYFKKSVRDLSLAQSAVLAAIPRAPSYYSPWGSHTKELFERQRFILRKMRALGMISPEELSGAEAEKISFEPQGRGIKAPHMVMAVQEYLVHKYGEEIVRNGGLRVVTTLDMDLQKAAEEAVAEGAKRNEELYGGGNAALVAEDPKTGQVLALVGSRDYFDVAHEGNFNAATQGLRQPGSALKPFVYLTAFRKGYTPDTVLFDVPTEFASGFAACPPVPDFQVDIPQCFHPQNFDDTFRGPINLRTALAQSVNIPAVKTLYLAGLPDALATLSAFGVTTLNDPSRYGLSLVLGGGEVKLIELVGAYGGLSQDGVRHAQSFVLEVRDTKGRLFESYVDESGTAVEPESVRMVNNILSDGEIRRGLFGASYPLTVFPNHEVALKTGTSNDYRDAWAIGYTPSLVIGVWAGNNDNSPMHRKGSSILAAVPIWSQVMKKALEHASPEPFARPELVPAAKPILAGTFMPEGKAHSILYYIDRADPAGPPPDDPARDPQFFNWETAILAWAGTNAGNLVSSLSPGTTAPSVFIRSPRPGVFFTNEVTLWATIQSPDPISRVVIYWNGAPVSEVLPNQIRNNEVVFSFSPPSALLQNLLEAEAQTVTGQSGRSGVIVYKQG